MPDQYWSCMNPGIQSVCSGTLSQYTHGHQLLGGFYNHQWSLRICLPKRLVFDTIAECLSNSGGGCPLRSRYPIMERQFTEGSVLGFVENLLILLIKEMVNKDVLMNEQFFH
jgi:hypothetical protein